ncbi:Tyrocidine synthase 3 [Paenibacillus plantiphilus]|uniref:Tyrocidine synthase 3 n=1 Tax=Paenibacillus plantiphilus TaxID=2905650 RepID=A0ABM9CC40_9BACL|nr:amino acid adenylation domain-containing protein [Paenibacillus plantiphilus]CAH1209053.1 Tyrocidine synthase 3 [Paenibacillus plantiphilus]
MNRDAVAPSNDKQHTTEEPRTAEEYWLDKLRDLPPAPTLQGDAVKQEDSLTEGSYPFLIPQELSQELWQRCKGNDQLIYVFMAAVLQTLIYKTTAQKDCMIGMPIHSAYAEDAQYNSFVLLRTLIGDHMTLREMLQTVKQNISEAYSFQYYPIEGILDRLGMADEPIFRIVCSYDPIHRRDPDPRELPHNDIVFHMLALQEAGQAAEVNIRYNRARFHPSTLRTFASAFVRLLQQFIQLPGNRMDELELISDDEKATIIGTFNGTDAPFDSHLTASQLFELTVREHPNRTALVCGSTRLTYSELNNSANRLARILIQQGVGPEVIVALIADRSPERVIAMLAILKAGGAFLPIDPTYPSERIAFMLRDSGTALMLAEEEYTSYAPDGLPILCLHEMKDVGEDITGNPPASAQPGNLAYMIYTSGSTGVPKGVMLEHSGLATLKETFIQELHVAPEDAVAQFASPSFDASVWEMFMALFTGAQLHLLSEEVVNSFELFASYMRDNRITAVTLPPNYLAHLDPEQIDSLRLIITAGSAVSSDLVRRWSATATFVNAYGPTESTICATMWSSKDARGSLEQGREFINGTVPIGKPILNNRIYILNHEHRMMPIGLAGELYISSPGIARGYRNREELSREKFVDDPYRSGSRMYGTGDMARWLADGNIEYLGRLDDQLKIRGYRIELGEIENRLSAYPHLTQGVVIAREEEGGAVLYAYFVSPGDVTAAELRAFMGEELPDYMIPSYFIRLEQLPLTPNGKVDRKALPMHSPFAETNSLKGSAEAPATEIERELLAIWQKILKRNDIGIRDHFFEIGGHSLKAMAMISEVYSVFGRQITVNQLMEDATVQGLALKIEQAEEVERLQIEPAPKSEYYPLAAAQTRMFVMGGNESVGIAYNIPVFLEIHGVIDSARLEGAAIALIQRHESLRTSFQWQAGEPVQIVHDQVPFELPVSHLKEQDVHARLASFLQPFELEQAPLFRMELLCISSDHAILLVDMHHIISDGVSVANLLRDYMDLYEGKALAPLVLQYKDYAVWQQQQMEAGMMVQHESYWKSVFADAAPEVALPLDYARPQQMSFEGERLSARLDHSQREQLMQLAGRTGTTLFMMLLASYSITLSKLAVQGDIVVGSPVAGRPMGELAGIVGMFVNMLPLRSAPVSTKTFLTYLEEVKGTVLDAFEHQQYPFDEMVRSLKIRREPGRNPLFNVSFALQNMDVPQFDLQDISVRNYGDTVSAAKFDLTLWATEDDEGIHLELEYARCLFARETVQSFMNALIQVIGKVVEQPDSLLGQIDIVDEQMKSKLLDSIAQTEHALDIEFEL